MKTSRIIIPSDNQSEGGLWSFMQFDINCLKMIIKGLWLFNQDLKAEVLQKSLADLLNYYPHLAGRVSKIQSGISMNGKGVLFVEEDQLSTKREQVRKCSSAFAQYTENVAVMKIEKGEDPLMTVKLTHLADGAALGVQCAHVCLDGDGFYTMMNNWSILSRGETITPPILIKPDILKSEVLTRDAVIKKVQDNKWFQVGASSLVRFIWQGLTGITKRVSKPLFVSADDIEKYKNELKNECGKHISTHVALLSKLTYAFLKTHPFNKKTECQTITVLDVRGRVDEIDKNMTGNAVINLSSKSFASDSDLRTIALTIDDSLASILHQPEVLKEQIRLIIEAAHYKLPYVPFNLNGMSSSCPSAFYVNNMTRFPIYDLDFGVGRPYYAFANDLGDNIKFWPAPPDTPGVEIIFRGSSVKAFRGIVKAESLC